MTPDRPHPIDAAIRARHDTEAATVDARAVLARVKTAQAQQSKAVPSSRRVWLRRAVVGVGVTVAACLVVGLFVTGNTPTPDKKLSAEEWIQGAKAALEAAPTDRRYDVVADWDLTPFQKRLNFRPPIRHAQVWTRGDQFVVLGAVDDGPPSAVWAFGQEPGGRVWIAPTRRHAIVYDKDELNEPLARYCELMSLRLVSTLGELLEKYDLFRKDGGTPGEPVRIEATLRPGLLPRMHFRKVELELDPATKVVRAAVLHRYLAGEPVGALTFTLAETATKADDFYSVKGHTDPAAVIHDGRPLPNPPQPAPPNPRNKFAADLLKRLQNRGK
jgi:hypothetical protein